MSLIVNGEQIANKKISSLLVNYKALCTNETCEDVDSCELRLLTKYYSACITVNLVDIGDTNESVFDNAEGYILIPSEGDLTSPKYALSRAAVEADTGLRILVALTEGPEVNYRSSYESWALENGFEYLEINTLDPVKDFQEREKSGLPRLMEALESNMWSTMQRAPKAVPVCVGNNVCASSSTTKSAVVETVGSGESTNEQSSVASSNAGSYVAPPVSATGSTEQSLPVPPASVSMSIPATTTTDAHPPASSESTAGASASLDPFDLELEDKEDNEIIDKYANFINEVKNFRTQATGGQLSDQARRDQAADMALKLAMMMGMDDESDSESD